VLYNNLYDSVIYSDTSNIYFGYWKIILLSILLSDSFTDDHISSYTTATSMRVCWSVIKVKEIARSSYFNYKFLTSVLLSRCKIFRVWNNKFSKKNQIR